MRVINAIGRVTTDIETRYTPAGHAVANFNMAFNRYWKNENGDTMEEATFIRMVAWRKQAETLAEFVKKGYQLAVDGFFKNHRWTDANNVERFELRFNITGFMLLDNRGLDAKRKDEASKVQGPRVVRKAKKVDADEAEAAGQSIPDHNDSSDISGMVDDIPF